MGAIAGMMLLAIPAVQKTFNDLKQVAINDVITPIQDAVNRAKGTNNATNQAQMQ
jgi:hypothetical protein